MTDSMLYTLICREMRPVLLDALFYWMLAVAVLALQVVLLVVFSFIIDDPGRIHANSVNLAATLHIILLVAVWVIVPVTAASAVQRDLEAGTYESLYATPVAPLLILFCKGAVIVIRAFAVGLAVLPVLGAFYSVLGLSWNYLGESYVLMGVCSICGTALGCFVSSMVRRTLLVPFALYGLVVTVLLVPLGAIALFSWWSGTVMEIGGAVGNSLLWAILHPWQCWPGHDAAFLYLGYLLVMGMLFLLGAYLALERPDLLEKRDGLNIPVKKWVPIDDRVNPVSAVYYRLNPFSSRAMQRGLFAAGTLGGLLSQVRLLNSWSFVSIGQMFNVDYLIFTIVLVSVLVASQEIAAQDANRDQLRLSLLSERTVYFGCAWGAVKLCYPLLLGMIVGRIIVYGGSFLYVSAASVDRSLPVFSIELLTYVPIGAYYVITAAQSSQARAMNYTGFVGKVAIVFMGCFVVEMCTGGLTNLGISSTYAALIRLGGYCFYSFFPYLVLRQMHSDDTPWKPVTTWYGKSLDE